MSRGQLFFYFSVNRRFYGVRVSLFFSDGKLSRDELSHQMVCAFYEAVCTNVSLKKKR